MARKAGANRVLRWRATGAVASAGSRGRGGVRGLPSAANSRGRPRARGAVLGGGRAVHNGENRFSCVGSSRIGADGSHLESGSRRVEPVSAMLPPLPPPPKSTGGAGRRSDGPPRGRPPKGMRWSREDQDWKPDPDAEEERKRPYVSLKKRAAPAPRGRPPEGTRWCSDARAYIAKKLSPLSDVGKTKFRIEVPPQPSKTSWSTPEAAGARNL